MFFLDGQIHACQPHISHGIVEHVGASGIRSDHR